MNRGGFVAQAFEPAGSGDFPVARSWSTGLESPVNPQAGKPALQAGSWVASFRFCARIGTMNQWRSRSPVLRTPSPSVYVFSVGFTSVAAAILAAVEGGILP